MTHTVCPHCAGTGQLSTYPPDPPWVRTAQTILLAEMGLVILWGIVVDLVPALAGVVTYWMVVALVGSFAILLPLAGWSQEPTQSRPRMRTRVVLAVVCGTAVLAFVLHARGLF